MRRVIHLYWVVTGRSGIVHTAEKSGRMRCNKRCFGGKSRLGSPLEVTCKKCLGFIEVHHSMRAKREKLCEES